MSQSYPKALVCPRERRSTPSFLKLLCLCGCVLRTGGVSVELKPELHRVLESRKRDQLLKQRKQEEEAHRKISPLEAELQKRHRKLEEVAHTYCTLVM